MADKKESKPKKSKSENNKINKEMLIGDLVSNHPNSVEVLLKNGIHCVGCPMTSFESIEQGCRVHGLDDKKIDKIIKDMNKADSKVGKSSK